LARRLGLDPSSLLADDQEPRFAWREEARFKHLTSEDAVERDGIASFGRAVASAMAEAVPHPEIDLTGRPALELREELLVSGKPFVGLDTLLALSWAAGIAVVHLRVFPWPQKRMAAMAVRVRDQPFVLLAKDAIYPAWIAFYLAHELGHITLGHVTSDQALVDLEAEGRLSDEEDEEEHEADAWALELLTGLANPTVLSADGTRSAAELARVAVSSGQALGIEPGTLALCFGYSTGDWSVANASLKRIYAKPFPVWRAVNDYARMQLNLDNVSADAAEFVSDILELRTVD
jgi:hypothetical protein